MRNGSTGEHTVHPPGDPDQAARLRALADDLGRGGPWRLAVGDGGDGEVPDALREVVAVAAAALAQGRAVTLSRHEPTLSTQEAADLLGVSRPTLVRLLDSGDIPYDQPRRHRRVLLADLVAYQRRCHHDQRADGAAAVSDLPG